MDIWYCLCSFVLGVELMTVWHLFRPIVTLEQLRYEASQRFPGPPMLAKSDVTMESIYDAR